MKTNATIRIVLFSLVIVLLSAALIVALIPGNMTFFGIDLGTSLFYPGIKDGNVSSEGTVDPSGVHSLQIDWVSGIVSIRPGDVPHIRFIESADGAIAEKDTMVWKQEGSTLNIQFCQPNHSTIVSKNLTIIVPQEWTCRELHINAASASVVCADLTIEELDFDGASGSFDLKNCTVTDFDIDTASGDVDFQGTLTRLDCDAASANFKFTLLNTPNQIDMDTASGDLELYLPADSGFTAEIDGLSCDFYTDFEGVSKHDSTYIYGDGHCRIDVDTMSGDLRILKTK